MTAVVGSSGRERRWDSRGACVRVFCIGSHTPHRFFATLRKPPAESAPPANRPHFPSPDQRAAGAGGKGGGAEKQLHFFEAVGGRASGPRAQQQQQQPADPAASLNLFLKRLRTLRSKSYEGWCLKTLGMEGAAVAS